MAWWLLLPSLATGIRMGWRLERQRVALLVAPAFMVAVVTAFIVANFGTMVRARTQVLVLLLPLIALGWSERHPGGGREDGDEPGVVAVQATDEDPTPRRPRGGARGERRAGKQASKHL